MRPRPILALPLLLVLAIGCASAESTGPTPANPTDAAAVRLYQGFYASLNGSALVYATINDGVRIAHQGGALTDEQTDRIVPKLASAAKLLNEAKAGVAAYLDALESGGGTVSATDKYRLAIDAVNSLLELATELGVAP